MAEHYKGHRIGSRKATIRRTLDESGEPAATKLGAELGLAEGTVRGWIRAWQKGSTLPPASGEKLKKTSTRPVGDNKIWVKWKGDNEASGYLVEEGDEQSIVRWRNGNETVVVNGWIERE